MNAEFFKIHLDYRLENIEGQLIYDQSMLERIEKSQKDNTYVGSDRWIKRRRKMHDDLQKQFNRIKGERETNTDLSDSKQMYFNSSLDELNDLRKKNSDECRDYLFHYAEMLRNKREAETIERQQKRSDKVRKLKEEHEKNYPWLWKIFKKLGL